VGVALIYTRASTEKSELGKMRLLSSTASDSEHDEVDPRDLAGAGGQLRHGLDVVELVRGSTLYQLLAVPMVVAVDGSLRAGAERQRDPGRALLCPSATAARGAGAQRSRQRRSGRPSQRYPLEGPE
jgi:hypothetical protein